jgi:hypothetical protein
MKSEIILPRIEISRTLPSNYSAPKAYLGKTQEVKLIDYGKAYVNLDNLIFRGLRLMKESRPDFSKSFYCLQKILVHLYFKSKIINLKDVPVLVIADGASPYLYHWLCDNLVRAHLAKKHYKNDFKVVLPKNFYEADFCLKSLEMILFKSGILHYFNFYLSNQDVKNSKPDPEMYDNPFARMSLKSQEALICVPR